MFLQVKSVCSNLRACGVRGHLGVFGVHYEADNSRLYVVCAKHITESQLLDEFTVFGTAEVKLNSDANGCSKVTFKWMSYSVFAKFPPLLSLEFVLSFICEIIPSIKHSRRPTRSQSVTAASHRLKFALADAPQLLIQIFCFVSVRVVPLFNTRRVTVQRKLLNSFMERWKYFVLSGV